MVIIEKDKKGQVMHHKHFFTLVELLIVIAIIAILLRSKCGFFMAFYGNSVF